MNRLPQTAEQIAHALPGCRRIGSGQFKACCPAHDDNAPSLAITQKGDRVLLICRAGCLQKEVIRSLQSLGLWPEKKKRQSAKVHTLTDKREMRAFVAAHEFNLRRGIPTATKAQRTYTQYQRVLYAPFSPGEVMEMHLFCLAYQSDVHSGKIPTADDDRKFRAFDQVLLDREVPYAI